MSRGRGGGDTRGTPVAPSPFADAFGVALAQRGLSLDAVRVALAERGHRLSVATLSYWRSGRSRPERAPSLAALAALEGILEVEPGALLRALTPRPPAVPSPTSAPALSAGGGDLAQLLQGLTHLSDDGLDKLSYQDLIDIDGQGRQTRRQVRLLARAMRDGADRFPVVVPRTPGEPRPVVTPILGCRAGGAERAQDGRTDVVDLFLDRPLRAGDAVLIEYDVSFGRAGCESTRWERRVPRTLPLFLVTLRFDPDRVPMSIERFEKGVTADSMRSAPVLVTASTLSVLFVDVAPGAVGVSWRW